MKDINDLVILWQEGKISTYDMLMESEYKDEYIDFCNNQKLNEEEAADIFLDYKDEELMKSQKIINSWEN